MQPVTTSRFFPTVFCVLLVFLLNACGGTDIKGPGKPVALTEQTIPVTGSDYTSPSTSISSSPSGFSGLRYQDKPVKVAILLPLSGPYAELGNAMLDAAQLALFDINVQKLSLLPLDTKGTALGATRAAKQAIDNEAKLILGPLFGNEAKAVAPIAYERDVNVISFSNDESLTGQGIFLLGHAPKEQVKRIADYALQQDIYFFASATPNDAYGAMVARALRDTVTGKGYVTKTEYYLPNKASIAENLQRVVSSLARMSHKQLREQERAKKKKATADVVEDIAEDSLEANGKALLLPEGGAKLEQLLRILARYDIHGSGIKLLGTGQWEEANIANRELLEGAWFASTPPAQRQRFDAHFKETYGYIPPRISSLAYDAVALSAALATVPGSPDFSHVALTTKRGFVGVDGIFRLDTSGVAERGLAIMEVTPEGASVIDPAPTSFFDVGR